MTAATTSDFPHNNFNRATWNWNVMHRKRIGRVVANEPPPQGTGRRILRPWQPTLLMKIEYQRVRESHDYQMDWSRLGVQKPWSLRGQCLGFVFFIFRWKWQKADQRVTKKEHNQWTIKSQWSAHLCIWSKQNEIFVLV